MFSQGSTWCEEGGNGLAEARGGTNIADPINRRMRHLYRVAV